MPLVHVHVLVLVPTQRNDLARCCRRQSSKSSKSFKSYFARIVVDTRGFCWDENGMGWDENGMGWAR